MKIYRQMVTTINVLDAEAAIAAANAHSKKQYPDTHTDIEDLDEAIQMLLDPGAGGDAYTGNLNEIGLQIEDSSVGT